MTHFRFRYKCMSYRRWRCRASRRRTQQVMASLALTDFAPSAPAWRRRLPAPALPVATPMALRVGNYVVSEEGDLQLYGHPDIRY
ncbi:hypothetical protein ACFST9_11635 [Hymenobacter monticola]|uniref:Uncharacterized protein n=1 Tax=Hymenobacter monticola TaxID=1705399 RepID=A0ABY4B7P4_9BACT|nr:hypothetical protein [Hymenobacter monticola]UOE35157.1 hypothetical protein MTP16_05775 [Hymenobacter monticola]